MNRFCSVIRDTDWLMLAVCIIGAPTLGLGAMAINGLQPRVAPPLMPPMWVWWVVAGVLFGLLGVVLYLVLNFSVSDNYQAIAVRCSVILWMAMVVWQMVLPAFVGHMQLYMLAFVWQCIGVGLGCALVVSLLGYHRVAAVLAVPFVLGTAFNCWLLLGMALGA